MTIEFRVEGRARRAALWLPGGVDPARIGDLTLVVFLHAYEERGDDFEHLGVGIGPALDRHAEAWFKAAVLLPQCPGDHVWAVVDRSWAAGCRSAEPHVDAAITAAVDRYGFDPARITLTGASMGGYGTFVIGARQPDRFAAFGPVCGGGIATEVTALAPRPVWAWHGVEDDVVPIEETRSMIRALEDAGGEPRFDAVEGAGHDVWDRAYADAGFAAFLSLT